MTTQADPAAAAGAEATGASDAVNAASVAAAAATAAATGGTGATQPDNWESRFTGLQGKHQQTVEAFKVEKGTLLQQVTDLNAALLTKTTEAKDFSTAVAEQTAKVTALTGELTTRDAKITELSGKLERQTLIMAEFPDLALFEARGLLPKDVVGDALKTGLTEFRAMLATTTTDAIERKAVGFTPDGDGSSGNRNQTMTLADVQTKQMEANARGDWKESARLEELSVAMVHAQTKKS